jgi:hypothetical protein
MSFRNTKTPTKAEIVGKPKYQVPTRLVHGVETYYLTPELEAHFVRLYPVTMNRDMMRLFGISFSTMQRFKRELGLQKKMKTIRHKQAQWAKRICEENGYYDSMRGKAPCEAAMEATRQLRASGWHPMQVVRKNKRRYQRLMQKRSEKRKELMRKERIRVDWGMSQNTNLHIPYDPYGKRRTSFKSTCRRAGYIPGKAHDPSERWIIYYTPDTIRGTIREQHGIALGFKFEPLKLQA